MNAVIHRIVTDTQRISYDGIITIAHRGRKTKRRERGRLPETVKHIAMLAWVLTIDTLITFILVISDMVQSKVQFRIYHKNYAHGGVALCFIHWDRVTHICVSKLTMNGSENGLSPGYLNHCWNIVNWTPRIEIHIFFLSRKSISKYRLQNGDHFVLASMS